MAKKPIKVTEVVLRDAHQSLLATRMTMDEMRPILPEMDKINYFSVECWGGATFDSCIRFLDEVNFAINNVCQESNNSSRVGEHG